MEFGISSAPWDKDIKNKIIRKNIKFIFVALYDFHCSKKNENSQRREIFFYIFFRI